MRKRSHGSFAQTNQESGNLSVGGAALVSQMLHWPDHTGVLLMPSTQTDHYLTILTIGTFLLP